MIRLKKKLLKNQNRQQPTLSRNHHPQSATRRSRFLSMRQTWQLDSLPFNILYDPAAAYSFVRTDTAKKLRLPLIGPGEDEQDGNDSFRPKYNLEMYYLEEDEYINIEFQAQDDLGQHSTTVRLDGVNKETAKSDIPGRGILPPRAESGPIHFIFGLDYLEYMPDYIKTLASGIQVYYSRFSDVFGSHIVYCGRHESFHLPSPPPSSMEEETETRGQVTNRLISYRPATM